MTNPNAFPNIEGSELVSLSWRKLLERDASVKKQFAASEFPEVTDGDEGTPCFREDEQKWYIFTGMGELDQPVWWCPFDTIEAKTVLYNPSSEIPSTAKDVQSAIDFLSKKELPNAIILPPESSEYISDGETVEYTLDKVTAHKESVLVYFSGVRQSPSTYELSPAGDKVIFNEAPAYGESILIQENSSILEYDLNPINLIFNAEDEDTFTLPVTLPSPLTVNVNIDGNILQVNEYTTSEDKVILNKPVTGKVQISTIYKGQVGIPSANTIGSLELKEGAVTESKLAENSVAEEALKTASVTTNKIANANVTEEKIANLSVTTDKIAEAAVTENKLSSIITDRLLGAERVTANMLQEKSVSMAKLGDDVRSTLDSLSVVTTDAGTNIKGLVTLATLDEVQNGTGGNKVVTADVLKDYSDITANVTNASNIKRGVVKLTTLEELQNGTGGDKVVTADVLLQYLGATVS